MQLHLQQRQVSCDFSHNFLILDILQISITFLKEIFFKSKFELISLCNTVFIFIQSTYCTVREVSKSRVFHVSAFQNIFSFS